MIERLNYNPSNKRLLAKPQDRNYAGGRSSSPS